jgi:hypothetical protein
MRASLMLVANELERILLKWISVEKVKVVLTLLPVQSTRYG